MQSIEFRSDQRRRWRPISGALRRPEVGCPASNNLQSIRSARGRRSRREVLSASPAGSRRPEISRYRRRDCGRRRGGTSGARRSLAALERLGRAPGARLHHGRARLCRGRKARSRRIRGRPRHFRSSARLRARRFRPTALARRLHDEHAPRGGRSGIASADGGGVCERRRRSRLVAPLPGLRWIADGPRRGRKLARTPRARPFARAHLPRARRAWRDGRHLQLAGAGRGHRSLRGDHLSRRALDLCAARFAADRGGHGRRRNHPGGARGGHAPARAESDLSEPHFTESNDDHDPRTPTHRDLLARTPSPDPNRRGRPYGFIPTHAPPPLAAIAPDICWHIAGLAKCIGAGLRLAYVVAPDAPAAWSFNSAMRALCVMASPISAAVATR